MSELPTLAPPYNPETEPFWTAAATDQLVLPRCDACGHHIWYPRSWCPVCGNETVTWVEVSGRGTVYACTILHRAKGPWAEAAPLVVAYVELEEGPRILTNIISDDPTTLRVGDPVRATFAPVTAHREGAPTQAILRFTRA